MNTAYLRRAGALAILATAFAIQGCEHSTEIPAAPKAIQVKTSARLGTYITDREGHTLYMFANDVTTGQSACAGNCEALWPAFNVPDIKASDVDTSLRFSDFTVLQNATGKKQLAYKGWPLYYYAPVVNGANRLEEVDSTKGEGVGGLWFVAKPDYSIMLSSAQLVGHNGKSYKSDYTEGTGKTIYFTDGMGLTLYTFRNDKNNKNNYTRADFSNNNVWPIYETEKIVVPSTLDKTLFGVTTVFGKKQLTYKGWPLYYFDQDVQTRGLNKGITFPALLVWPVATKDWPAAPF
jgi:predicted lipoprotein with Yx(FWY)xxD motif